MYVPSKYVVTGLEILLPIRNMTTSNLYQNDESIESEFQKEFRITTKSTHEKELSVVT